ALLLGATAVTFAVGLSASLNRVADGLSHASAEPVQVLMPASGPGGIHPKNDSRRPAGKGNAGTAVPQSGLPTPVQAKRAITAALRATPGTLRYVEETGHPISVAGLSQQVAATAFRGDARWTGYAMISGHWYTGPGQAVVGTGFLTDTGKSVGDTVTIVSGSRLVPVKIVGEVFDTGN